MDEVRALRPEDAVDCRRLWEACFPDSADFNDWFFQNRFLPRYGVCLIHDGRLASAVYSLPIHVRVRDVTLCASMLAGVSTFPEYQRRGYMRQVFLGYMQELRAAGIPLAVHTPAHLPTFFSRGHFPVSDTLHLAASAPGPMPLPKGLEVIGASKALSLSDSLQHCYSLATAAYSGMVSRSYTDFRFKLEDYFSDHAFCLLDMQKEQVHGYAMYYKTPEQGLHGEELVSLSPEGYARLIRGLSSLAEGARLHIKLPPDAPRPALPGAAYTIRPQGVAGAAHMGALLSTILHDGRFRFEVRDSAVPENCGVWNGAGGQTALPAQITLDAGRLVQFLFGYRSIAELAEAGDALIRDKTAAAELDAQYPKQNCFIIDEY